MKGGLGQSASLLDYTTQNKTHSNLTERRKGTLILLLALAGLVELLRRSRVRLVGPFLEIVEVRVLEEAQLTLQGDQLAS